MHKLVYQASPEANQQDDSNDLEASRYRLCHTLSPAILSGVLSGPHARTPEATPKKHGKRKAGTNTYPAEADSLWNMLYRADEGKRDSILRLARAACDWAGVPSKFLDDAVSHIEHSFLRTNAALDKQGQRRSKSRSELIGLGRMVARRQALLYLAHNGFACKLNDSMMYSKRTEEEAIARGESFDASMRISNFYCDSLDEKPSLDSEMSIDFDEESAVGESDFSVERLPPEVLAVISKLRSRLDYGMQTFLDHLLSGESAEKSVEMMGIAENNGLKYMEVLSKVAGKMSEEDRRTVFSEFGWQQKT